MPAASDAKYMTNAGWDDVPHLDAKTKADLLESTPPFLRDARSKGVPSLGAGAIYPVEESVFLVDPFRIPAYWPKAYGFDVGWNRTAAIWGAHDRDTDTVYLYAEHYRGQAEPSIHATAIRARDWEPQAKPFIDGRGVTYDGRIPGVIDPAARGRSQKDGEQLIVQYRELGLDIAPAINSREAGIHAVFERLSVGRLKVFKTLSNWRAEHRFYRRDEKGQVVKKNDHLMDATRYLVISGLKRAKTRPLDTYTQIQPEAGDTLMGY
jgi:hypothetical protein